MLTGGHSTRRQRRAGGDVGDSERPNLMTGVLASFQRKHSFSLGNPGRSRPQPCASYPLPSRARARGAPAMIGGGLSKAQVVRFADPRPPHAGIFFPDLILRTAHLLRCAPCGAKKTARNTRLSCAAPGYFPPIKGLCHDRA